MTAFRCAALLPAILGATAAIAVAQPAAAAPLDDVCGQLSPTAALCTGQDKAVEAVGAECRRLGTSCVLPAGSAYTDAALDSYQASWVHRAAAFQYTLGRPLPLRDAQWLGTHNSFNSTNEPFTLSHTDSNQQLSLRQQLDADMRSLELDLHEIPRLERGGAAGVTVCHGRGPTEAHLGCTTEPLLSDVLPQIATWLNAPAHQDQVVLLYLEDALSSAAGYAETVRVLDDVLSRPDGSSLIYRPAAPTGGSCAELPLDASRDDVLGAGRQVVLVGKCRAGWSANVFSWDASHVESGSTPAYQPFPTCDATYARSVYDAKLVRYYEDSTLVARTLALTETPQAARAGRLTPDKVASMVACGVNLFGFDQLLPDDGRIAASIWSWASGSPDPQQGACAVQRADGRWSTRPCTGAALRPAACVSGTTWSVTAPVSADAAATACQLRGATFAVPRAGDQNARLRQAAGSAEVWLDYRVSV